MLHTAPPIATEEKKPPEVKPPEVKNPPHPDFQQLFAANFQPHKDETMNPSVRAAEDEAEPFDRFQRAYWESRYKETLVAFEELSPALKNNDNLLFVKANSLLAMDRADEAIDILEKIIANERSRYVAESKWYLALGLLKNGEMGRSKRQLEVIAADENSPRREEAVKVLQEIK